MSSRHPRAAKPIVDGLYRGLSCFLDLEARIAALPEELDRGDAFEIFVEGYLGTMRVFQRADLWLVGQVPLDVRCALNLPSDAKGIDGVFRTKLGQDVPYQVKFRIRRAMLGVAEVATFLGLTERASDRLLISNANHCAPDVENRDGLRLLRGSDFDALSREELADIAAWLEDGPAERLRAAPRQDQVKTLQCIANAMQTYPRATVVMPCGSGKTLVQLWAAEQLSPRTVLVLVPSLALIHQTLREWSRHTSWGDRYEYLCVCSDPTVSAEQDAITIRSTDVPFRVDTDPDTVCRFLSPTSDGVRVVFSTYQSAPVVAVGLRGLEPFDLAIFDEAHKTTGLSQGTFAFALDDARLPIRKRLFFTATPRHIDIRHRDREGDFRVVSMDDPTVYGPPAYAQTFADAVALGIICDYRVVVAVVDPREVDDFAIHHGITLVRGDQQATRWVATQIAVSKAIRATGATRVITFHARIQQADDFASATPRGIGQYLDGFIVDHVNGAQRVADRRDILSRFHDARRRLVTNARCLTEGVDLPAVDMVVFTNPRRSRVDIVQAVGRAMRKPRDGTKTLGYVVVPVLLAPHETPDLAEACAETDWEDVVDVLAALREQDARLDEIIRVQQIAKGRGEVFNPRAFAERVQVLGPLVALEALERHVGAVVLESLGVSWDERYGQLVAFKERVGHCNVPEPYEDNPTLGRWVRNQRSRMKAGTVYPDRIARLDALGFVWEPRDAVWDEMCWQLTQFKAREGHCRVPASYPESPSLSTWVDTQRQNERSGKLSNERRRKLEGLGFVWDPHTTSWQDMYRQLAVFKAENGHCNVPVEYSKNHVLGPWVRTQRQARKSGELSDRRIGQLDAMGFVWDPFKRGWDEMLRHLVMFKAEHKHCNVPQRYQPHLELATWVNKQRTTKMRGRLSHDRIRQLDELGFIWSPFEEAWEDMFRQLLVFKTENGDCNVPLRSRTHPGLGSWANGQRTAKLRGELSVERAERLEKVGFAWNVRDIAWEKMCCQLADFKSQHGHCDVSSDSGNRVLGRWATRQRSAKRSGTLSHSQVERLNVLGFHWEPLDQNWESMFRQLFEFKSHNGHCNVPARHANDPVLGRWVSKQRASRSSGTLSADRAARLNELGLVWDPFTSAWEDMFGQLSAFKADNGHCNVPAKYSANRPLGMWVYTQRTAQKSGSLSRDRKARLEALGFTWQFRRES